MKKIGYNLYIVRKYILPFGVIILVIGLGGLFYLITPRVVDITPADGASNVSGSAAIRIRFSRLMDADSVLARLNLQPIQTGKVSWEGNTLIFTPQKPWQNGTQVTVRLDKGARAKNFPQLGLLQAHQWSFRIGSPKILYLYPSDGPARLYMLDPLSGNPKAISQELGDVVDFSVSPNGAMLVLAVRDENGSAIYSKVGVEGEPTLLRSYQNSQIISPTFSPSLDYLAFVRTDFSLAQPETHIYILNLKENPAPEPMRVPDSGGTVQYPSWSANDILAYYDGGEKVYRFYDARMKKELTTVTCQTGEKGTWSADSQSFVFAEILMPNDSSVPTSHLLRFVLNQHKLEDISQASYTEDASPQFSPDGQSIVFGRKYLDALQWTPGRQIWIMEVATLNTHPLLQEGQFNHYDFTWSPDGEQIAYMRFNQVDPTAPAEIWLINRDGSQNRVLVHGGYNPQWIP
ncbi:MAG: Ig-like domain-containing protein [Anaerolineales bacterium]